MLEIKPKNQKSPIQALIGERRQANIEKDSFTKRRKMGEYRRWFREYSRKRYRLDPEFRSKQLEQA